MKLRIKARDSDWMEELTKSLREEGFPVEVNARTIYLPSNDKVLPNIFYIYVESRIVKINKPLISKDRLETLRSILEKFNVMELEEWRRDLIFNKIGYSIDKITFGPGLAGGNLNVSVPLMKATYPYLRQNTEPEYTMALYSVPYDLTIHQIQLDADKIFDYLGKSDDQTREVNIKRIEWFIELVRTLQRMGFKLHNGDINIWMDWEDELDEIKNKSK